MRRKKPAGLVWDGREVVQGSEHLLGRHFSRGAGQSQREMELEIYKQRLAEGPWWLARQRGDRTPLAEFDRAGEEQWWNETYLMAFRLGLDPPERPRPPSSLAE